ncbi:hypothetical protein [Rhodanobacter lindaniclasticus]
MSWKSVYFEPGRVAMVIGTSCSSSSRFCAFTVIWLSVVICLSVSCALPAGAAVSCACASGSWLAVSTVRMAENASRCWR